MTQTNPRPSRDRQPVSDAQIWFSPIKAYSDYLEIAEKHGLEKLRQLDEFQKVRETKILAVLCFALYAETDTPWYLQLDPSENTDGRIMRQSPTSPGTMDKGNVEVTTYMRRSDGALPGEELLEQLKRTKTFTAYHKFGGHDLVLIELGCDMGLDHGVDFDAVAGYMRSIKAPYGLWAIEEINNGGSDSMAQITICNPGLRRLRCNIGKAWHDLKELGAPGVLLARRTGDPTNAGIVMHDRQITRAVWEFNYD